MNRSTPSPPPVVIENRNFDGGEQLLPQEALLYVSRPSLQEDGDEMDKRMAEANRPESRRSDVGSVAGSVRRRYDGSGYDGW